MYLNNIFVAAIVVAGVMVWAGLFGALLFFIYEKVYGVLFKDY